MKQPLIVLISGGGTGGHVFPAIAIANALKVMHPNINILFVGAKGKLEMQKVPEAGYPIKGLWISGFQRKLTLQNLLFPIKLIWSLVSAFFIVLKFKPNVAVGVGGYASGPTLKVAEWFGIPTVLQEANSYPGVTNRLLGKGASKVCLAYEGMEKYFDAEKIVVTGNPIRSLITASTVRKAEAAAEFKLQADKKTVLITGGSLGAKAINLAIAKKISQLLQMQDVQIIWQTGKLYLAQYEFYKINAEHKLIITDFIKRMDCAYALADVIVSRAGGTIAELAIIGKPAILLPSSNVAEDHQTKNVKALVARQAALLVTDDEAEEKLVPTIINLLNDETLQKSLSQNFKQFAKPKAAKHIAEIVTEAANLK